MKILFIGNRLNVLTELFALNEKITLINILVLKDSLLEKSLSQQNVRYEPFYMKDKQFIVDKIKTSDFDVLISNGCPFVLPVSKIKLPHQKFINIHPTYLPYLKGRTPINGLFYNKMAFFGATMHFMDDGIDTGQIIHQEKIDLTADIDLAMVYYMSFRLEGSIFRKGFKDYILNNKPIIDREQEQGNSFNRDPKYQILNLSDSNHDILKTIKAFGISSQGSFTTIQGKEIIIFSAIEIINQKFLAWFKDEPVGNLLLELDHSIYVKTKTGIIKLTRYKWN
jgi:methionyl-tRNA formyltransferase|tara:strand:+ start:2432 stop:3274 length:843 start_codon:yes stop_codon:yes gene_type:complete